VTGRPKLLVGLLPSSIACREVLYADRQAPELRPEEQGHVARAVERRRAEFAWGRHLARRALYSLGGPTPALPPRKDRVPHWPEGFTGSITHTHGYCGVAVARIQSCRGIGVDVEFLNRMRDTDWHRLVCFDHELRWIADADADELKRERMLCVFSAKESFYKAQYPVTGQVLGFKDVRIHFDESGSFAVAPMLKLDIDAPLHGRICVTDDYVASAVVI
jgi:4'-phosphopantetheinyl transferase EntD